MTAELSSLLQAASGFATLLVAIVSIVIALKAENRNHNRFRAELDHSRDLTAASIRPLLSVYSQIADEKKGVILVNRGIGPAIVTSFEMKRGNKSVNNMKDLFDIGDDVLWEKWRYLPREPIVISANQELILVRITKKYLLDHGCTDEEAESILVKWQLQKSGVEVCFDYEDALGNIQKTYNTILR